MKAFLIKQGIGIPILYFGTIIIAGFFAADYSHLGQHASELGIHPNPTVVTIFNTGAFITGSSVIGYGLGLLLKFGRQFSITATLTILFGITFLFGAYYPMGSPWHSLYGLGFSIMMLPFGFLYELKSYPIHRSTKIIAILAAFFIFLYLWGMLAGLDPTEQRGLTQRCFGMVVFGFMAYSAYLTDHIVPKA